MAYPLDALDRGTTLGGLLGLLLGLAMVAVVLYCLARAFVPALRPAGHRRDLGAWHLVMAAAMAVMLLAGHARTFAVLGLVVFAAGVAWSGLRAVRRPARAAYVRLGIGCAAMAVMLLPAATLAPANAATSAETGDAHAMHHHGHVASAPATGDGPLAVPSMLVVVLLLAVLAVVVLARLLGAVRRGVPTADRLDAGCEVLTGVAMAAMLGALV